MILRLPAKAMHSIDPSERFGAFLKTRFLGEQLREELSGFLDGEGEVRVDLSGVSGMSHSFADECFGDLFSERGADLFRNRLHLSGLNPPVRSVLRLVFSDRSGKASA